MPTVLLVLFLSYILFMFFGGLFGFVKAKPFKFSDKVDLFYIEPRRASNIRQGAKPASKHVRVIPLRKGTKAAGRRIPDRSLPVVASIQPPRKRPSPQPMVSPVAQPVGAEIQRECLAALKTLGYGSDAECSRFFKAFCTKSGAPSSCERFLQSLFIKGPDESKPN